jgi:Holliday junction resolvase RusA-like endonuclease
MKIAAETLAHFEIRATPRPQGSKRFVGHAKNGRAILVESSDKGVRDWRVSVIDAAKTAYAERGRLVCPVVLEVTFYFARPKSHYGKRGLLPSAPAHHTQKPDLSKIIRGLEDAMTDAAIWRDDSTVVEIRARKEWAEWSGAQVTVLAIDPPSASPGDAIRARPPRSLRPR